MTAPFEVRVAPPEGTVASPAVHRPAACCLCEELEQIARGGGDSEMVVSATPTGNTVRFYIGRGFRPMAEPFTELLELEPEDVHMRKRL